VLADGVEKDLALGDRAVDQPALHGAGRAPADPAAGQPRPASSGPFTVQMPVAASYAELERAMSPRLHDGKLYFSKDFPQLYLEKPGIYASRISWW
jgi:hypothetical protein